MLVVPGAARVLHGWRRLGCGLPRFLEEDRVDDVQEIPHIQRLDQVGAGPCREQALVQVSYFHRTLDGELWPHTRPAAWHRA
jgi:hypothetical protein